VTGMSPGKHQPADDFRVPEIRLNKGDSHGSGMGRSDLARKAYSLLNLTPAPKLNRYAESRADLLVKEQKC